MNTQIYKCTDLTAAQTAQLAQAFGRGAVGVFATDTVYGIGTGALCKESVQKIYTLKKRPANQPLQLLVSGVEQAQTIVQLSPAVTRLAHAYWPGGLTLILPPTRAGKALLGNSNGLGLRVPAYPALCAILDKMEMPLASTSANLHGQPVLTQEADVLTTFNGYVDYILLGGALSPTASSVLDVLADPPHLLREGSISKEDLQRVYGASII